jgi:hypothetical protein
MTERQDIKQSPSLTIIRSSNAVLLTNLQSR